MIDSILVQRDAGLLAVLFSAALLGSWAAGWRMGKWAAAPEAGEDAYKFDDASLALLGLLLAFTFSPALAKHEQRRTMVIADSNAIGDFYTCASLLKEPVRPRLQNVIREYAELRLETARHWGNRESIGNALHRVEQMHEQMVSLSPTRNCCGLSRW